MRLLHTMLRVRNLERALAIYVEQLGMKVVRRMTKADGKSIAFVGYGDEGSATVLELVEDPSVLEHVLGNGFGHIAIEVTNAQAAFESFQAAGVKVRRWPELKPGNELIGSIEDADGYKVEIIQPAHVS